MSQILFEDARPAATVDPGRADVACFVGLAALASTVISDDGVRSWLQLLGVLRSPFTPPAGAPVPPLPPNVRAWFLEQGWINGIVSSSAAPATSLAAAVDAAGTTIVLGAPLAGAPPSIVVDNEVMAIVSVDSTGRTLSVTRGSGGSAVSHALGAPVFAPLLGALALPVAADGTQFTLKAALTSDPPLFVRAGAEIAAVSAIDPTGMVLTVERAASGTTAVPHNAGDPIVAVALDPFAQLAVQISNLLPAAVQSWLQSQGWLGGRFARDLDQLYDVPLPLENYAGFTAMFGPGSSSGSAGSDYLAAAVRSFFAQGGKRCYIVRMGDPVASTDTPAEIAATLQSLLIDGSHDGGDPSTWHGVGHLAGLPDVSFLAVPDLPILSASPVPLASAAEDGPVIGPVQFAECSSLDMTPQPRAVYPLPAPRLSFADYGNWAGSVGTILQYLVSGLERQELHLREIQFVAAFPLPQDDAGDIHDIIAACMPEDVEPQGDIVAGNISSAFLQLAYPWLKTTGSSVLLESLEPPDGALVGILARNALKFGTFNSATKIVPGDVFDLFPVLPASETKISPLALTWGGAVQKPLIVRLSLFGFGPSGLALLSDVTAYPGEAYRSASVKRLVSVICRAARRLGETVIFGSNGPALWGRVQTSLQQLLTQLWSLNALDGASVTDAFSVRCDRSTMTQNDLDNGRLVAVVSFTAASKIDLIRLTLAYETGATSAGQIASALAQAS